MSRGYSKVYSRKVNSVSQASIQFDKLFENSNRPSAAKSAGTVGRWGVISCTSLRSTNINGRRDETISNKRMRMDYGSRSSQYSGSSKDPFSFDTDPDGKIATGDSAQPAVKPKKFFKSRNNDAPPEEIRLNASVYMGSNRGTESSYGSQGGRKNGKGTYSNKQCNTSTAGSKKFFTSAALKMESSVESVGDQTEAMNLSSPIKAREEDKPPIVLRIIKGTSHLVSNIQMSPSVQQPAAKFPSDSNSVIVRSSRRRNHVETSNSEFSKDRTSHSSITASPKKKNNKEVVVESNFSQLDVVDDPPVAIPDVASLESSEEAVCSNKCEVDSETPHNLPSSLCYPPPPQELEFTASALEANEPEPISSEPAAEETSVVEKDDQEKLLKAEELLSSTYIDFTTTAEKLLQLSPRPAPSSPPPAPSKPFIDQDWFSDSEGSNSISDHINTIAASQGEPEPEFTTLKPELENCYLEETLPDTLTITEQESEQNIVERTSSPATKKGSIFKSRSLLSGGSKKRRVLYKHKWADDKEGSAATGSQPSETTLASGASLQPCTVDEEFEPGKLTRVTTWPVADSDLIDDQEAITRVRCSRKDKGFYTVVRNVKKAHQIQESGEFQEFNDDVEYILDALQDNNPIGTRCLSSITLASKCMAPAFRMHVRAHGTVAKFFRALHDATKDQSLGLCTATVMFVLSQDRLNMDLDRHSLELMLNLLESDASHRNALDDCGMSSAQLHKNKQKVRELCAEIQSQGHAKHLNLDNITVGHLAMETLLSLTSRRAGEWFKEELRELGGLEHIVKTICECFRQVDDYVVEWTEPLLDKLRKVDRCLKVLENVTHQNEENQLYLLKYGDGILVDTLIKLFRQCDSEIPLYPVIDPADKESTGVVIREALLATLRVLINLTHDFNNESYGSTMVGERAGIVDATLHLLLQVPNYVPEQKKFDLLVLALILLINLVEHSITNRKLLFEAKAPPEPESMFHHYNDKSAVEALIALFYLQEEHARAEEVKTDAILDGKKDTEELETEPSAPKTQEEFIEETVAKLLQKAGRNMEHTLIGAYIGLLLGYLIIDNKEYEVHVRRCLPEGNFKTVVTVLQKVYNFMNLTASAVGSSRGIAQTERVINCLIKSDASAALVEDEVPSALEVEVSMLEETMS